jgi:hypothetical protein
MQKTGLYAKAVFVNWDNAREVADCMKEMFEMWFEQESGNEKVYLSHQFIIVPSHSDDKIMIVLSLTYSY